MENKYLYEIIEAIDQAGKLDVDIPEIILSGLSEHIVLREYQEKAFKYFITYYENKELHKNKQLHKNYYWC